MVDSKIASLKAAGAVAAKIHREIAQKIAISVNVLDLEKIADELINEARMKPAFQGFNGYPNVTCISINDEIVHGMPRNYLIRDGDVVKVDLGVNCNDWLVDTARTHIIGSVSAHVQRLVSTTQQALEDAIAICRVGVHVGDIGAIVDSVVTKAGFAVIRDLTGHGIGKTLQEPPSIPNFGLPGQGPILTEGMVVAIEPITSLVETDIVICKDGWTIKTKVPTITAHFEHTLVITKEEPIVVTREHPLVLNEKQI